MDPYSSNQNPPQTPAPDQTYPPNPGYPQDGQFQPHSSSGQNTYSQPQNPQGPQSSPVNNTYPQQQGQSQQYGQPQQSWGMNRSPEPIPVQSQIPNDPSHQLPNYSNQGTVSPTPPTTLGSGGMNNHNTRLTPPPRPKRYDKQPFFLRLVEWLKSHWWAPVLVVVGLVLVADITYQIVLPYDRIPSGINVDGIEVGGMKRDEAVSAVNKAYADANVDIFFGSASVPQQTTRAADLGISVNNKQRLENISYPVWLRLIPSSSFWVAATQPVSPAVYSYDTVVLDEYTLRHLGDDCRIEPKDATITLDDGLFESVPSEPGGNCDVAEFKSEVRSSVVENGEITIKISMNEEDAKLSEEDVASLVEQLNQTLGENIPISAGSVNHEIPSNEAKSWLAFRTEVPSSTSDDEPAPSPYIAYDVDKQYMQEFIDGSILSDAIEKPGTTKVTTHNYQERSRTNGASGTAADIDTAVAGFRDVAEGKTKNIVVPLGPVGAIVEYTRTYDPTPEGFKALVEHFASDNEGRISIVLADTSGREPRLNVSVGDREKVPAGGIEGLFLAYAARVGIDDGTLQSTTRVSGSRDYEQCIEQVLVSQDSDCIDGLLSTMGNAYVQNKMNEAGLPDTNFSGAQTVTSARDIFTLIRNMDEGETPLNNKSSLLTLMRRNLTRDGIYQVAPGNTSVASSNTEGVANQGALVSDSGRYVVAFTSEGAGDLDIVEEFMKDYQKLRGERPRR